MLDATTTAELLEGVEHEGVGMIADRVDRERSRGQARVPPTEPAHPAVRRADVLVLRESGTDHGSTPYGCLASHPDRSVEDLRIDSALHPEPVDAFLVLRAPDAGGAGVLQRPAMLRRKVEESVPDTVNAWREIEPRLCPYDQVRAARVYECKVRHGRPVARTASAVFR